MYARCQLGSALFLVLLWILQWTSLSTFEVSETYAYGAAHFLAFTSLIDAARRRVDRKRPLYERR